jgi:hypothetical protein
MENETEVKKSIDDLRYFEKINAKKRIIYSVVYEPMKADAHKEFMTAEAIENMAHEWLMNFGKVDEHHDFIEGAGKPVESFIVNEGDEVWVKSGRALPGSWVLGIKVTDDAVWKQVQRGEINALSWAGVGWIGKEREVESDWYDDDGNRVDPYEDGGK